jgi:serine/threonine-protein kinase
LDRVPGTIIAGRYRLVEKLGSGGMGAVWLSHDLSLDSNCAVKIIDPEKSNNEEVRKRFIREARAAAQLRGPHVVDVFDRGEYEGVLYIAMEYLEGEDLCGRLARVGKLDAVATYRVIAHVARALSSAHALGIVHRDLKPENIYLVPSYDEEIAKVLDFGIAQHEAYRIEDSATREGSFLGTPYYVSPEQARGKPTDHRSDLWSLGVITYQCLTGTPPFDANSLGELMGLILYEPIPKIRETNPALPPKMEAFWQRAIKRDREQRFQSAREFANELGQALGLRTVITVPTLQPRRQSSYPEEVVDGRIPSLTIRPLRTPSEVPDVSAVSGQSQQPTLLGPDSIESSQFGQTEQAVTSSRAFGRSWLQGFERGYGWFTNVPTRPLLIGTVALGIFFGGVAMFAYINGHGSRSGTTAALSSSELLAFPPASSSPPRATSTVVPPQRASVVSPEVILVPTKSSPSIDIKPPESLPKKPGSVNNPGRRPPAGTPDYGI